MKIYDDKHIKNVDFVGAHNSGKTTLAETMLFEAGLLNRRGTVEQKNTVSDYHEIEQERGNSVFATPLHTEWRNYKINIIDTPGLDDFIGEIISSIRVADSVVTVLNAQHGVEVGTEIIWNYIDKFQKPTLFVINQIDHLNANFDKSFNSIKSLVGNNAVKIQYPLKIDGAQCILDILKMIVYKFPPEGGKPKNYRSLMTKKRSLIFFTMNWLKRRPKMTKSCSNFSLRKERLTKKNCVRELERECSITNCFRYSVFLR